MAERQKLKTPTQSQILRPAYERYTNVKYRRRVTLTYKQFEKNKVDLINAGNLHAKMGNCSLCNTELRFDCEDILSGVIKDGALVCAATAMCELLQGRTCYSCGQVVTLDSDSCFYGTKTEKGWRHSNEKFMKYVVANAAIARANPANLRKR